MSCWLYAGGSELGVRCKEKMVPDFFEVCSVGGGGKDMLPAVTPCLQSCEKNNTQYLKERGSATQKSR